MVEHRIPNPGVGGSSPSAPATDLLLVKLISFIYNKYVLYRKVIYEFKYTLQKRKIRTS